MNHDPIAAPPPKASDVVRDPGPYAAAAPHGSEAGAAAARRSRALGLYGLLFTGYCLLLSFWQREKVPPEVHYLVLAVSALGFFPLGRWVWRGDRTLPMFELICLFYLAYYVVPLYALPNEFVTMSQVLSFTWSGTYQTLLWVLAGMGVMQAGYFLMHRLLTRRERASITLPLSSRGLLRFCRLSILGGLLALYLQKSVFEGELGGMRMVFFLTQSQLYVGLAVLGFAMHENRLPAGGGKGLYYGGLGLAVILGLSFSMLEYGLVPLVIHFMCRWHGRRRFPVGIALLGVVGLLLMNAVKREHRANQYYFGTRAATESAINWFRLSADLARQILAGSPNGELEKAIELTMIRFDFIHAFQHVHATTPGKVPRYNGETYRYLWLGWVPRALWPDKPSAQEANVRYAVDYEVLIEEQLDSTMMGIGHLTEAYANFGPPGFGVTMFVHGCFYALIGALFNRPDADGSRAVYLMVMLFFLNGIGSATAASFYQGILLLLTSAMILRVFAASWGTPRRGLP